MGACITVLQSQFLILAVISGDKFWLAYMIIPVELEFLVAPLHLAMTSIFP